MYQDQAAEIDRLTQRIALLQSAIRVVGVYNSTAAEIKNLLGDVATNQMIPVTNWAVFADKGGLGNQIEWFPIDKVTSALDQLYKARETVKQEMYEITGLSDIIRGASDPRETLGAQQLKGNFASKRLVERQQEVANFARDLIEIKAEIICNKFDEGHLRLQSGFDVMLGVKPEEREQVWAAAVALLRNDLLRGFRIDVETDSTVQPNAEQDRQQRMEFVAAISGFLQNAVPAAAQVPQLGPLLAETMLFAVRGWSNASGLEAILEDALDQMNEAGRQAPQGQPEDQKGQAEGQAEAQAEAQKLQQQAMEAQLRSQTDREKIVSEERARMMEVQSREAIEMAKIEAEKWKAMGDWQYKARELDIRDREASVKEAELGIKRTTAEAEIALGAADRIMDATRPEQLNGGFNGV
jgi:hypothetical protein